MVPGIFHIVIRSVRHSKRQVIYQLLIIALLSAVITGSLLTGESVRNSLKKTASERLGNTSVVVSSGLRFFDISLAERLKESKGIKCTGLLELRGFSQSLKSQKEAPNTNIYAVAGDFFEFHDIDSVSLKQGEIAVNGRLAENLGIIPGDELIIRFNELTDIPADAPFAPAKESGKSSAVLKVVSILEPAEIGNFSLSISQITPMNIFMNLSDLEQITGQSGKINRLLTSTGESYNTDDIHNILTSVLKPADIGITLRLSDAAQQYELVSDRIFIDNSLLKEIEDAVSGAAPVLTYLGNRFVSSSGSTPYSFVSALPSSVYPEITSGNDMVINRWLAEDLKASAGDTVKMFWYSPDSLNKLIERSRSFIVRKIVNIAGIWSDSLLMPAFPGISGSESCSDWDAGVPIKMDEIRRKDEDYWNRYRGTPKAFINYDEGAEIWGNNWGPATSVRFPAGVTAKEIEAKLAGSLDPYRSGFVITDIAGESVKAANESVDFSSLFLSLGFFLILASLVLLSFAVTSYFDSKRGQVSTLFALGFKNRWIKRLLLLESGFIILLAGASGAFAGYPVNIIITRALNSVWKGAVQTNTLEAFFSILPVLTGFAVTVITAGILVAVKINSYLKKLGRKEKEIHQVHSPGLNLSLLAVSSALTILFFSLSFILSRQELSMSFASGTMLLISLVIFWRQYFLGPLFRKSGTGKKPGLSRRYYTFYPSEAVTPILFIAAGIFAVFITGANRMNFDKAYTERSGGTGGYLLWCETTVPVREDLNSPSGRRVTGLDEDQLRDMRFVQGKRSAGNDASCLNLNHITTPPLLGIDPGIFIERGSFSFSKYLKDSGVENPWQFLDIPAENNTIYGIADQTVLEWGMKIKIGDTLVLRSESGQPLRIIMAAGLKSSVFQGYVLVGMNNFIKYYPSVSGSALMLVDGDPGAIDIYRNALNERLALNGITIEPTSDRLAAFYEVTNTYLSVFGVFGAFGMIIGIAGLGFILLRNYNKRKREFALMLATGFSLDKIRHLILSEQILILFAGVTAGVSSAVVATLPSVTNNPDIPWKFLTIMVVSVFITGFAVLRLSVSSIKSGSLTATMKQE